MTRAKRLRYLAIAATGLIGLTHAAVAQEAPRPNIVLIFVDDMAYGDLSANDAGAWVATPNLDSLAQSGVRFTNGYSASPVCGPSRTALLTGSYANRYGVWWNPDTGKAKLPASQTLLPALMRDTGYATAVVGKWNLPTDPRASADVVRDPMVWGGGYWPEANGGYAGVGKGSGAGGRASGLWGPAKPGHQYLTDRLTGHAVDFIRDQSPAKPFFLYLAYNGPHSPLEAHQRFRARVAHLDSEPKRLYAAMVLAVDEGVGAVRKALSDKGLDRNTMIVFVSDNGPAKSGFRGYQPDWPKIVLGSVGPLSGTKGTYREGGIREPFLVSWPAGVAVNQVRDDAVTTIDLYRTFADLSGAKIPAGTLTDGTSLAPMLRDPKAAMPERDLMWAGRICRPRGCVDSGAMRTGKWKLLIEDGGKPQLFDLVADPGERRNLAASNAVRVTDMTARYQAWKARFPDNASGRAGPAGERTTAE